MLYSLSTVSTGRGNAGKEETHPENRLSFHTLSEHLFYSSSLWPGDEWREDIRQLLMNPNPRSPGAPSSLLTILKSSFPNCKVSSQCGTSNSPSPQVHLTPGIKVSSTMGPQDKNDSWTEIMDLRDWCRVRSHWNPWWHIYRTRSGWQQGERNSNSNCSQQNEQADWLNAGQMVTIKNNTALLPKWGVETNCQR